MTNLINFTYYYVDYFSRYYAALSNVYFANYRSGHLQRVSGAMMLKHLGETGASKSIEDAVRKVIAEKRTVTYDLGGTATMSGMTDAIIAEMRK